MTAQPAKVKAVPEKYRTVTPHLVIRGAAKALDFYKAAFGAQELGRVDAPGGLIGHAEMKIGDSVIMLADEFPGFERSPSTLKGSSVTVHLYVENADELFARAVKAGAAVVMPMNDAFWGDRYGHLTDPFGHVWSIATHMHDYTVEEMQAKMKEAMAKMGGQ